MARRICANLLADSGDMSSKQLVTLLKKQLDLLANLDETFEVEMALLKAVSGDYGVAWMKALVKTKLPSAPHGLSYDDVLTDLQQLKTMPTFRFLSDAGHEACKSVITALELMKQGEEFDNETWIQEDYLRDLLDLMAWMCKHTLQPTGKDSSSARDKAVKVCYGKEAYGKKLGDAKKKHSGRVLTPNGMDDLHIFSFLGTEAEQAEVNQMSEDVIMLVHGTSRKKQKKGGAAAAEKASSSKGAVKKEEVDPIMAMFD